MNERHVDHEPNEAAMAHAIRIHTTVRDWQNRIKYRFEAGDWKMPEHADAILSLTVYEELPDVTIAEWLHLEENDVKCRRAQAVGTLLEDYGRVLKEWVNSDDSDDVLVGVLASVEYKTKCFRAYVQGDTQDTVLGDVLDQYIRSGHVGSLVSAYIDLRCSVYALHSEEFKSVQDLVSSLGYRKDYLRELISSGKIVGIQTDRGWYGSEVGVREYQQRQRPSRLGGPRHPYK